MRAEVLDLIQEFGKTRVSLVELITILVDCDVAPYNNGRCDYFAYNFAIVVATAVCPPIRWNDGEDDWKMILATGKQRTKFRELDIDSYDMAVRAIQALALAFGVPRYSLCDLGLLVCMYGERQNFFKTALRISV